MQLVFVAQKNRPIFNKGGRYQIAGSLGSVGSGLHFVQAGSDSGLTAVDVVLVKYALLHRPVHRAQCFADGGLSLGHVAPFYRA